MKIYDIDAAILSLIDEETGEISDFEAFAELQMQRESKIENMALWYKELIAEGKAIREEERVLGERRRACENKAERLKSYLGELLNGEKFKTAKTAISYRKSTAIEIEPEFVGWAKENAPELLTFKEPEPNKTAIKAAIADAGGVNYAAAVERMNISIK